jgi:hypothetical protein
MATSKTPKQPPFPHPPLEVGVAQYPTPVVPDFYTKSGHIILVVKESVEKGPYNPKPLDGSIVYSGRDANKWPSSLYLVHQAPTPDGEYVYNTYANDRTLSSQDPWNYGIDYSLDDPTAPIYSREYIVPRSQYSPVSIGSTDPVFGGTSKISKQSMRELPEDNRLRSRYVIVQRTYETIPSTAISGQSVNKYGSVDTTIKQIVLPSATASTSQTQGQIGGINQYLVSDSINPISSAKSEEQKVVMSQPPDVVTYEITHDLAVIKNTTSMILRQNLSPPSAPSGAILDVSDADAGYPWIRRSTKSLQVDGGGNPILPPSRSEFSTITYQFPGIIYDWNTSLVNGQIQSQLSFFENRYPITMIVPARHDITYSYGQPDISTLSYFKVITQPWAKIYFSIPDGTIHPPAPVSLQGQTILKNGISYSIGGGQSSQPSHYIVGQELLIGGETTRWQGNIWLTRLTYTKEPANTY